MPRPARNCRPTKAVNPASMELGQLLALPRQTLVLLASARHLVTTGSKARLAERIHAFEHAIPPPPGPVADVGANSPTPTLLSVNVDQQPTPPTAFSEVQITQLRSLISAVAHSERVGPPQPPRSKSKVQRFLLRLLSHHLLRGPSQLARSTPQTTLQWPKMAFAALA